MIINEFMVFLDGESLLVMYPAKRIKGKGFWALCCGRVRRQDGWKI